MKLLPWGFCALLLAGAVGLDRGRNGDSQTTSGTFEAVGPAYNVGATVNLAEFADEIAVIERELAETTGSARADLLAMYGRSAAASGHFDLAAAAYAMFLDEFGTDHPHSQRIVTRLADCLFPFKYDRIDVFHSATGPRLEPAWRMGYSPRPELLREAVHAFELAASLAQDQNAKGSALLKLGWVHRVLGDWDASTKAWDRCADEAAQTKSAADALWLAAENLEWTNRPVDAAERLQRMAREYPQDARLSAAIERVEYLEAEARRLPQWLSDPVGSLKAEIDACAGVRSPQEVYRSAVRWLQRRNERDALIAVSRWACSQKNWPVKDRIACRFDLVDALLASTARDASAEAVQWLREILELAPDDGTAVHATLRCSRVLNGLERYGEACAMMEAIAERVQGSRRYQPIVLSEFAEMLLSRGDRERAAGVLDRLAASHPDYDLSDRFDFMLRNNQEEGAR